MMNESSGDRLNKKSQQNPAIVGKQPDIPDSCCKVQRVTKAYQLTGVDDELRRRYEADEATLHELADYVNNRITTVTLNTIGNPTDMEPATVRGALEGEKSIPATRRDDVRATLAGQLDLELLTGSFVSHETVRKHLNKHLDVSTSQNGFETFEELDEALKSFQEQYKNGVRSALERAGKKGLIEGTNYRIFSTRIECEHCSKTYRLQELLEDRGCDCQ